MTANYGDQGNHVREILRAETAGMHEALHLHPFMRDFACGQLGKPEYTELMIRLLGFYRPLDQAIFALDAPYAHAPRTGLLTRDVAALSPGRTVPEAPLNRLVTHNSLGGVLYVIEGAMLGGAQLDRAADRVLAPDITAGRSYWAWCRAEGKDRWRRMLSQLGEDHMNGRPLEDVIAGAKATFTAFASWVAPLTPVQIEG